MRYAHMGAVAYRQSIAAQKLVAGPDDTPFFFGKENSSNGCMATVDVTMPASPLRSGASGSINGSATNELPASRGGWVRIFDLNYSSPSAMILGKKIAISHETGFVFARRAARTASA